MRLIIRNVKMIKYKHQKADSPIIFPYDVCPQNWIIFSISNLQDKVVVTDSKKLNRITEAFLGNECFA